MDHLFGDLRSPDERYWHGGMHCDALVVQLCHRSVGALHGIEHWVSAVPMDVWRPRISLLTFFLLEQIRNLLRIRELHHLVDSLRLLLLTRDQGLVFGGN
jgi:hypothetical protein